MPRGAQRHGRERSDPAIRALVANHDVDLEAGELRLPDTKTGARMVPLSPPAARVLAELPRIKGNPWVIPGFKANRHLADLNHYWDRVRERADLQDVRFHDIRHSFASRALALGESLSMIGKLLGHNKIHTTARYANLARDSVWEAAERIVVSIEVDILLALRFRWRERADCAEHACTSDSRRPRTVSARG